MTLVHALNTAWMWKCAGEHRAFRQGTVNVANAQLNVLRSIVGSNRDTCFGRQHGFAQVRTAHDFQQSVPRGTYEDHRPFIDRMAGGEPNILTREPVRLFEPTSGSTGGEKLIPYTSSLRRQFQRGVAAWMADLLSGCPAVRRGRAYWSVSPAFGDRRYTTGGIPIGFDEDAAYLGWFEQSALSKILVAPPAAARAAQLEAFRYCTLLVLLAARDLSLISVWSPTFLTALITPLREWGDRLSHDIKYGTFSPPTAVEPGIVRNIQRQIRADPRRAQEVASIFRQGAKLDEQLRAMWPQLALISCWADGAAALALSELKGFFPQVQIQPKGLLATEGFVSFPLLGHGGGALAIRSHFFEFEEVVGAGRPDVQLRLAHELEKGVHYRVVLTNGGGLYRFQLRDEVRVVGFLKECPLITFVGKADCISDQVGEKLAEVHVRSVLQRVQSSHGIVAPFSLLVPVDGRPPRYRLYLQPAVGAGRAIDVDRLQRDLESGLSENPHYRYAVGLAQLAPVEVRLLDPAGPSGWQIYERFCSDHGQKTGDIKPVALERRPGWVELVRAWELPTATPTGSTPPQP